LLDVYAKCIVSDVSVPLTILGLLKRVPSHGYDLKRDYDAYFGRGRMQELTELRRDGALVDALLADHALFHLTADLRWIDNTSARLADLAALVNQGKMSGRVVSAARAAG
jgi:hypothetical protein